MFNNRRIKKLEERNRELLERISELGDEVARLKNACTMRVGEYTVPQNGFYGRMFPDSRPTATAIDLIKRLMEYQKLDIEPVSARPATYTVAPKTPA